MDKEPQSSRVSRSSDSRTSGRARPSAPRAQKSQKATEAQQAREPQPAEQPKRARPKRSKQADPAVSASTSQQPRRRSGLAGAANSTSQSQSAARPARKPRIGDTRPAPASPVKQPRPEPVPAANAGRTSETVSVSESGSGSVPGGRRRRRRRGGRGQGSGIHGNIYLGRVQSVLPGMETAFVDIGTPKNAVLYRGDVHYDSDEIDTDSEGGQSQPRIEDLLSTNQSILCQVTKNPIGEKGARLTQEVSLAGRFVVLVPNSSGFGISKRLPDAESRRLRSILDKARPEGHGVIVRTAAEKVTAAEIKRDIARLVGQWNDITKLAAASTAPALLYREPAAPLRLIREELNSDYRGVIIDDRSLHSEVSGYVSSIISPLADRVEYYNADKERLPLFERYYVTEQLKKALEPKVWLPSGGSLIIEHTEALTVVDVNTGKNVGSSSLEETVLANNLEAAEELARQLRLRDIGGIIVVDFVDMEIAANRAQVSKRFRDALARDKTRTQVLDISGLGLMEMTRKRSGQGLLESLSDLCSDCSGRGYRLMAELIE